MLGFRSKNLKRDELILKLCVVLESCDRDDFKTKKFTGLLYDYIPYNTGLKARLEMLGKSGAISELLNLNDNIEKNSKKIKDMAANFSAEYGFKVEAILDTILLIVEAKNIPFNVSEDAVEIKEKDIGGNFSKRHGISRVNPIDEVEALDVRVKDNLNGTNNINKKRIIMIFVFLIGMVIGTAYVNYYFDNLLRVYEVFNANYIQLSKWMLGSSLLIFMVSNLIYVKFKKNIFILMPIFILLLQISSIILRVEMPLIYEMLQLLLLMILLLSFVITSIPSIKASNKVSKINISSSVIFYYYASGIIYLVGQYIVRISS